ncbi:MAG: DNA helicase [Candidatus Parabeggiatoa sp. nov. 2]|nr:MAG: DNA helicase [Beggiatoa sp. 4572_84]RKZ57160.1 MAG: DNA helicase [Gammaproteobacteria bacterium]
MLNLTTRHKAIRTYYKELSQFNRLNKDQEGTVKIAFQHLLEWCAHQCQWTLVQQETLKRPANKRIRLDGVLFDQAHLPRGYWEAKDSQDNLPQQVQKKLTEDNYPQDNILFQTPQRAILIQNGRAHLDLSLDEPAHLVQVLEQFFNFKRPEYERWNLAANKFKGRVPNLAQQLFTIIRQAHVKEKAFEAAFNGFAQQCRQAINPNLSDEAILEMLVQHMLTERIFRHIFKSQVFAKRNIIAREIETVIDKLTAHAFNREAFFEELKYFYNALEDVAATINESSHKQHFLNTVYERFFQGFSIKVADTHGIIYTPQPIVDFMIQSVNDILQKEFGKSLASQGVHILDPFVGTGNFIVRIMREIALQSQMALKSKYRHELHCNEIMLLPYYIASMNIEHEYLDLMGEYQPFDGICLADTFELAENQQVDMLAAENTERVKKQQTSEFFVIIGNPPYNAWQANENDNNKNRQYPEIDRRVRETYSKASKATNRNALSDPYVKAIRWATDRIGEQGIVAFVTNNSFLDGIAFDGLRKLLHETFYKVYVLDLGGNIRKNPKLSGTTHNVFGIQAGVCINFFVKQKAPTNPHQIFYARMGEEWHKQLKYQFLQETANVTSVDWQPITPDKKHSWLTEGLHAEFEEFIPLGTKEAKAKNASGNGVIFKIYGRGILTGRDAWTYNFNPHALADNMQRTIKTYNELVAQWLNRQNQSEKVDDFVLYDDSKISWALSLKTYLKRGIQAQFTAAKMRRSLYRPFTQSNLFFDRMMIDAVYLFPKFVPTPETETENQVICLAGVGNRKSFGCIVTNLIASLDLAFEKAQCFPFYTYDEDGSNRKDNITDWALNHSQKHYQDENITKWAIFYYVYGLLHHPGYRHKYAANLKRELPRLPMTPDFWTFSKAGEKLAYLHLNYEQQPAYPLKVIENPNAPSSLRVGKMRLSKDKTQVIYNDFITLDGLPKEAFDYQLGNRSALEWIIEQYRVKVDKRSGITNDPNRLDDEHYILELLKKVTTVSLETLKVIEQLTELKIR